MAVRFNGDDASTEAYFASTGLPGGTQHTILFWLYPLRVTGATQSLVYVGDSVNAEEAWFEVSGGQIGRWSGIESSGVGYAGAVTAGTWYRVALVQDGATTRLYVGTATGALTEYTGTAPGPAAPTIMRVAESGLTGGEEPGNYRMAGFKTWDRAFTAAELPDEFLWEEPVLYSGDILREHPWRVAETADHSGNGNNLTAVGTPTTQASPAELSEGGPSGDLPTAADTFGWGAPLPSSDDFTAYDPSDTVPDPAKWSVYGDGGTVQPDGTPTGPVTGCWVGHDGNGRRCTSQVTVQDGYLRIHGEPGGDSGAVSHVLGQQHGRWEIRARMLAAPAASGDPYHGVAIIWPDAREGDDGFREYWPEDGEYDFWENNVGDDRPAAFIHYPHPTLPVEQEAAEYDTALDISGWHHYAVEWTADHVKGFVDGEEWFSFSGGAGPNGRSDIQAMPSGHLTLQLDDFFGTPTLQEAYLDVAWARVYAVEEDPVSEAPVPVGAAVAASGQTNTITAAAPTGVTAGDHQVVTAVVATTGETVNAAPAGWLLAATDSMASTLPGGDTTQLLIFVSDPDNDPGSSGFSVGKSGTRLWSTVRFAYRGGPGPTDITIGTLTTAATTHAIPTQTTTVDNSVVVGGVVLDQSGAGTAATSTVTQPAGWDELAEITILTSTGTIEALTLGVAAAAEETAGTVNGSFATSLADDAMVWSLTMVAETVTAPAQTITVGSPIAAPAAPGSPTVLGGNSIVPTQIPAPAPPGSPTVIPGSVTLAPTAIASPAAPGAPTIVHIVQPTAVAAPAPPGAPTIVQATRPPLRIDFWAVDDDGSLLCPLPQPVSWDTTLVPGEAGAVTLEYPNDGLNSGVLLERVTADRDLLIRIRTDGTHATSLGARLYASDGDEISETGTRTYYGRFLTGDLDEAPLPYNQGGLKGEWGWADATAGDILHAVLTVLQDAGYLQGFTWSFDGDVDSRGVPWTSQTNPRFPPGRTALEVAQQLREWGMCEFEVTADFEVRAYEPTAVGTDHTATDPPTVFRVGRDLAEAPRRTDVSAAATTLMIAGADGVYVEVDDPTAIAVRGRKIGQFLSEGNLASSVAALAYGELELPRRVSGTDERTRSLTFDQDQPVPLRELMPLDWVYDDTGTGLRRERIAQIQVSQAQGEDRYSGGIVLGDLISSRDVAIERQLSGLAGGQIITGASVPSPAVDDGKPPGQVEGVGVVSAPYPAQDVTLAYIVVSWANTTENDDGTPMGDLAYYEVQYRYAGGNPNLPTEWIGLPNTLAISATQDGLVGGELIHVRVRAVDQFGRVGAWSAEEAHVTKGDADAPPTPSDPVATSYLGIFTVTWDGLGSAEETQPPDFSHVEVHASLSAAFVPDRPLNGDGSLNTDLSTTYLDRLSGAGTMPSTIGEYGQTWYARLVAVDKSNNASDPSTADSATLVPAGDGDISAVSIGKLTAGIMSALMTISGIIRTAATGARVELDTTGLRCYSASGATLLNFSIPSSLLTLAGRLIAGAGIGVGATIDVNPTSPPSISMYPNATTERYRLFSLPVPLPGGLTGPAFGFEHVAASGSTAGPAMLAWEDAVVLGHKTAAGALSTTGGNVQLFPGDDPDDLGAYLASDGAYIQVANDGNLWASGTWGTGLGTSGSQAALFVGEAFTSSGFSGQVFGYGATMASFLCPVVTVDGALCQWTVSNNTTTGFTVNWSGTDQHWTRFWCFRI